MDISGLIQSYDSRTTSSAALNRAIMAPHFVQAHPYSGADSGNIDASHQQQPHNPFSFGTYAGASSNGLVPTFANNYIQQRPVARPMQTDSNGDRGSSFTRNTRQGFIGEHHSQSSPVKAESSWNVPSNSPTSVSANVKTIVKVEPAEATFATEVDNLMKTIQIKSKSKTQKKRPLVGASFTSPNVQADSSGNAYGTGEESSLKLILDFQDDVKSTRGGKKRYRCTWNPEECTKTFQQKTHLDIHLRSHTGERPYPCQYPGCGRTFSQLGNLKTHERRHNGQKPYPCDICGKAFAQRGNVRAHKIVHKGEKPFLCRLDDCQKRFSQLGNLKSHQNKFHIETIRALKAKYESYKDGDIVDAKEKDLWEYFADMYKNSNKGIKGRGKDRKVGANSMALSSGMKNLSVSGHGGYSMTGAGRGNIVVGMNGVHGAGRGDGNQYEVFDADDASQASFHSGTVAGSVGTIYEDAPVDSGFESGGRDGGLAFGDRIY